jgi:hypothetical protein
MDIIVEGSSGCPKTKSGKHIVRIAEYSSSKEPHCNQCGSDVDFDLFVYSLNNVVDILKASSDVYVQGLSNSLETQLKELQTDKEHK